MKTFDTISKPFKWLWNQISILYKDIIDFFKDLLSEAGSVSSMRFWRLIILINLTIDWQHAIWTVGIWDPTGLVMAFIAAIFGLSLYQKNIEMTNKK